MNTDLFGSPVTEKKKSKQDSFLIPDKKPIINLYKGDCFEAMKSMKDNQYSLAIVDPPFGIGFDGENSSMVTNNTSGKWNGAKGKGYVRKDWDNEKPTDEYFNQLLRVTKNQIIWGGNYFSLPPSGGWVVWDKKKPENFSLSMAELAWVSHSERILIFRYLWHGFQKQQPEERFHPTQKPVALYKWLLKNYAKPGDTILDTHGGSRSLAIACYDLGFDHDSWEIDPDYHADSVKRFEQHTKQVQIF